MAAAAAQFSSMNNMVQSGKTQGSRIQPGVQFQGVQVPQTSAATSMEGLAMGAPSQSLALPDMSSMMAPHMDAMATAGPVADVTRHMAGLQIQQPYAQKQHQSAPVQQQHPQHHHHQQQMMAHAQAQHAQMAHAQQQRAQMQQQQMHMQQQQQMHQMQQLQQQQQLMLQQQQQQLANRQTQSQPQSQTQTQAPAASVFAALRAQQQDLDTTSSTAPLQTGPASGMSADVMREIQASENPKMKNSKFLNFIDRLQKGEVEFRDNDVVEVDAATREARAAAALDADEMDLRDNSDEIMQHIYANMTEEEQALLPQDNLWEQFQEQGEVAGETVEEPSWGGDWAETLAAAQRIEHDITVTEAPAYEFMTEAPSEPVPGDAFQRGVELFEAGDTHGAIASFEAAVRLDGERVEAWRWLGQALAQQDEDFRAIAALQTCLYLDPYDLPALLMLGVSHTNNFDGPRALLYLRTWMLNNPAYAGAVDAGDAELPPMGYGVDARLHQQVSRMFLEATKLDPNDADLWTVLGVLYHITSDFDLAADAFRAAVRLRPDNAELWNKLGATLANADNNTEALGPYRRALQLRPGFVRAQSNLGICFYNQGQHDKAIPVFLDLLEGSPENKHVWSLLRMSLTLSGRSDAAQVSRSLDVSEVRRALEHDV